MNIVLTLGSFVELWLWMLRMEAGGIWVEFQLYSLLAGASEYLKKTVWISISYLWNGGYLFMFLLSCVWLFATPWSVACQTAVSIEFSRQDTGLGCHFLLQWIFQTQGLNSHLLSPALQVDSLPAEPSGKLEIGILVPT